MDTTFLEVLADLDGGWGRVDLAELDDVLPDDVLDQASQFQVQGLDPAGQLASKGVTTTTTSTSTCPTGMTPRTSPRPSAKIGPPPIGSCSEAARTASYRA